MSDPSFSHFSFTRILKQDLRSAGPKKDMKEGKREKAKEQRAMLD